VHPALLLAADGGGGNAYIRIRLSASPTLEARKVKNLCWQTTPGLQSEDVSRSTRSVWGGGGESRMSTTAATSPHHHITSPVLVTGPDITSSRDGSRVGSGSGSGVSGESETESRWTNTARHHHASQPHRRLSLSRFRDRVRALSFKIGWLGRGQRVLVRSFVRRARSFGGLARSLFRQAVCGGDAGSGRSGGDCACGPHAARLATQSCPRCDSTKYLSRRPDSGPPLVGWLGVFQTGRSASVESCVHM